MKKKYNYFINDPVDSLVSGEIERLDIPYGTTKIKERCFYGTNLKYVSVPETVLSIDADAFNSCESLETLILNNGLETIGDYAFLGLTSLREITIPETVTTIGNSIFSGCNSLTIRYNAINATTEYLGLGLDDYPASGANIKVIFGKNVEVVPEKIFWTSDYNYSKLGAVEFEEPSNCTTIKSYAFRSCSYLRNIILPSSLKTIESYAFQACGLTNVTIPDSVTNIMSHAFANCGSLKSITIGTGVKSIGYAAFSATSAPYLNYKGTTAQWRSISKGEQWDYGLKATYVQCTNGQISI